MRMFIYVLVAEEFRGAKTKENLIVALDRDAIDKYIASNPDAVIVADMLRVEKWEVYSGVCVAIETIK